ncbi:hypothetical protein BDK51DRAFT_48554 [Blyttiomyces helicus]|uniref:Uncharacterized protein n=1 Tax=Blyttiomyces helicus TaxID=388810 RepID=A0A4V1IQ08_9FUNG|nr:hypothetical protein BDK51DRAFT_48554 [Blyttiomyces helicus]|eukprot:RKO84907.1 hypothetical protein BDK51DRAFT_48554 [Blyttiomyces helicus]
MSAGGDLHDPLLQQQAATPSSAASSTPAADAVAPSSGSAFSSAWSGQERFQGRPPYSLCGSPPPASSSSSSSGPDSGTYSGSPSPSAASSPKRSRRAASAASRCWESAGVSDYDDTDDDEDDDDDISEDWRRPIKLRKYAENEVTGQMQSQRKSHAPMAQSSESRCKAEFDAARRSCRPPHWTARQCDAGQPGGPRGRGVDSLPVKLIANIQTYAI